MEKPESSHPTTPLSKRGDAGRANFSHELWGINANLWDPESNPNGYLSLWPAESVRDHLQDPGDLQFSALTRDQELMLDDLLEFINKDLRLERSDLSYGDFPAGRTRLRKAIADFLNRGLRTFRPITKDNVVVTAGVTQAIEAIGWTVADEGEAILLGRPYYLAFPVDLDSRARVKLVEVAFGPTDPFGAHCVKAYEDAMLEAQAQGVKIRALMLCSPHNPYGRCFPRDTLIGLMRLCEKYQIHLISDEIYAFSVFKNPDFPDAAGFTSVLSIDPNGIINPDLVHVMWGLSKDFGANGLRIGCIVSYNQPFLDSMLSNALFTYPPSPSDLIATRLLSDTSFTDWYIKTNSERLAKAYLFASGFLNENAIPYHAGVNAAFFLWVDLRTPYLRNQAKKGDHSARNLLNNGQPREELPLRSTADPEASESPRVENGAVDEAKTSLSSKAAEQKEEELEVEDGSEYGWTKIESAKEGTAPTNADLAPKVGSTGVYDDEAAAPPMPSKGLKVSQATDEKGTSDAVDITEGSKIDNKNKAAAGGDSEYGPSRHNADQGTMIDQLINKKLFENKVMFGSGDFFGSDQGGWWRIVFTHSEEVMREGFKRILKAIE